MRRKLLPTSLTLYVTYKCQLRCPHCFLVETDQLNRFELQTADILEIVDQAAAAGVFMIIVSGGDPFLHPDIELILKRIRRHGMLPLLGITGVLVEDAHIELLKHLDIPTVQVSLDGSSDSTNGAIRGTGTLEKVIRNVKRLVHAGIDVNLATCMHRGNFHELNNILELAISIGISKVKLAFYRRYGKVNSLVTELDETEIKNTLIVARKFEERHCNKGFVISPLYSITTGQKHPHIDQRKVVVISANGSIRYGEEGDYIGHIKDGLIAETYQQWKQKKKLSAFDRLISELKIHYDIHRINDINESLPASAMILAFENRREIFCQSGLNPILRAFLIIHEIGHVATNTLFEKPLIEKSAEVEKIVNIWALSSIQKLINPLAYPNYVEAANNSEHDLYRLIEDRLENDLILT